MMMKRKTKIILGVVASIVSVLAVGYVALCLIAMQGFSSPVLAVLSSPTSPTDQVWLLEEGFQDRGITLLVKSPSVNGGQTMGITSLDWDGLYSFEEVRWSGDGRLAVFSLRLAGTDGPEVMAFAFDFSTGKSILPAWQGKNTTSHKTVDEWKAHQDELESIAQTHGGLTDKGLAREEFRARSRNIWVWQVPKG